MLNHKIHRASALLTGGNYDILRNDRAAVGSRQPDTALTGWEGRGSPFREHYNRFCRICQDQSENNARKERAAYRPDPAGNGTVDVFGTEKLPCDGYIPMRREAIFKKYFLSLGILKATPRNSRFAP